MSKTSNPNFVKFGPTEMIVQFSTDRGEMKTSDNGEYFFRGMTDRRFCFVNPDLERKLIDLGYRAGERVGITRQVRNRMAVWAVRLIDAEAGPGVAEAPAPPTAIRPAPRPTAKRTPPPLPDAKYAPPPVAWPETEAPAPATPKPVARAIENRPASSIAMAGIDELCGAMERCLLKAVDMMAAAQKHAVAQGFSITFQGSDLQDLASTIYIQQSKVSNMDRVDRDRAQQRVAGGQDPWSRR